jgi:hypothetical protein
MLATKLDIEVVDLDVQMVETIPINWQGRWMDSGRIDVSLAPEQSYGEIDYAQNQVRVEFNTLLTFSELADLLEDMGAPESTYAPINIKIKSTGHVLPDHSLRLQGVGNVEQNGILDPSGTKITIRAPSQCRPDDKSASCGDVQALLEAGERVTFNFNPQEKRVDLVLPETLGGGSHEMSIAGSYTLARRPRS